MKRAGLLGAIVTVWALVLLAPEAAMCDSGIDAEYLGNPFLAQYPVGEVTDRARTIWDMEVWNGNVYFGVGDWGWNQGPVDLWHYNPRANEFRTDLTVDEDSIDVFRVLDGSLYIPGVDSTESWDFGNLYRNSGSGWEKLRTIPWMVHVLDVAHHAGSLFVTGSCGFPGTEGATRVVYRSADGGVSWERMGWAVSEEAATAFGTTALDEFLNNWAPRFLDLQGKLYVYGTDMPWFAVLKGEVFEILPVHPFPDAVAVCGEPCSTAPRIGIGIGYTMDERVDFLNTWEPCVSSWIERGTEFRGDWIYILRGASGVISEHGHETFGLFRISEMAEGGVKRVALPDSSVQVVDLSVSADHLYVLANSGSASQRTITIWRTEDLCEWECILAALSTTAAASFAVLDQEIYIGLGAYIADSGEAANRGDVFRVAFAGERGGFGERLDLNKIREATEITPSVVRILSLTVEGVLASFSDELPESDANFARTLSRDELNGAIAGMVWDSPDPTDLTLWVNQNIPSDATGLRIVASGSIETELGLNIATDCNHMSDLSIQVSTQPEEFVFPFSASLWQVRGACSDPAPPEQWTTIDRIVLFPSANAGELRIHSIQFVSEDQPTSVCNSIPLTDIFWFASFDDESLVTPDNHADIIHGADESGEYYGMEWDSPEDTDLTIGDLDRFDLAGVTAIRLTLSAEGPVTVLPAAQISGDYCGSTWRYATTDAIKIDEEMREYVFNVSELTGDPFRGCAGELAEDGLEDLHAMILVPEDREGGLRVYGVAFCRGDVASDTISSQQEETAVWTGSVIDDFADGDSTSLGGTSWTLDSEARVERAEGGNTGLHLANPGSGTVNAEVALCRFDLGGYEGLYVVGYGTPWGPLALSMEVEGTAGTDLFEGAAPMLLNQDIREFRFPFSGNEEVSTQRGMTLQLSLLSTHGAAEAMVHEVGFYDEQKEAHASATAVVEITPLPEPDPLIREVPAASLPDAAISSLVMLGNPFSARFSNGSGWEHARTVWDMQLWGDRIYLAHGDGSSNAGPTDVWYYDLSREVFVKEATVDEEEIRRFVVSEGTLFIPGFDPREQDRSSEWEFGNLYRHEDAAWAKLRTIPWGLHLYDILLHDGFLFVSGDGSEAYVRHGELKIAFTHVSSDNGRTWELHYPEGVNRIEELFVLDDGIYASAAYDSRFLNWLDGSFAAVPLDPFPALPPFTEHDQEKSEAPNLPSEWRNDPSVILRASHVTPWLGGMLYFCSFPYNRQPAETNSMRYIPETLGIYHATSIAGGEIQRLDVLPVDMMARDAVVRDGVLYILAVGEELDSSRAVVYAASDLQTWVEAFSSDSLPASAYSMEVANGCIFLGLGGAATHSGEIHATRIQ